MDVAGDSARAQAVLDWYLGWLRRVPAGDGPEDDEVYAVLGPGAGPEVFRRFLTARRDDTLRPLGEPVLEGPGRVALAAARADGQRMRIVAIARSDGEAHATITKAAPDGYVVREAVPEDGPALADLCRRTPIVDEKSRTTLDYGDDYLAATALAEERDVMVVEHDGQLLALHGCAYHDGVVGDLRSRMYYLRHTRIDPLAQKLGLFSALNGALFERGFSAGAIPYSMVAVGNDRMLDKLPDELRRWPWRHRRFSLDCRQLGDEAAVHHPVDASDAVPMVTALRAGLAVNPVPTVDGLRRRLARAPHLYGPDRLVGTSDAVVGVGRQAMTITEETGEMIEHRVEVVAYDVGAADPAALEQTLRAWCQQLADEHVDDLIVDVCEGAPHFDLVSSLARSSRSYLVNLGMPPPPDATGFHIDPALI